VIDRAEIIAFDAGTHSATLRYAGSQTGTVAGTPVSASITAAQMVVGEIAGVPLFGADGNPLDALVVGVTKP
jgi:hypothetical protein